MEIRQSTESDLNDIINVHTRAFKEEGPVVAKLAADLLSDQTALPLLSLIAENRDGIVGHILFTKATIPEVSPPVNIQLLAPLGVIPESQKTGTGTKLINRGLEILKENGTELVFVLGHPEYYPRCGFAPAGRLGFEAPYPIPEKDAGAWMVLQLKDLLIGQIKGKIKCSEVLDYPEHWRE